MKQKAIDVFAIIALIASISYLLSHAEKGTVERAIAEIFTNSSTDP